MALCCVAAALVPAAAREFIYNVGPFDQLQQRGDIDVVYRCNPDSTGIAVYASEADYSAALHISNNNGRLMIKELPDHGLGRVPTLYVYSDFLQQVKSEGNATLDIHLEAATPVLGVSLTGNGRVICDSIAAPKVTASITTGNGTIVLRGHCTEARFNLTGSGLIQADGLQARTVRCNVLGTGSIGCAPEESLDVRGIGTTKIYYSGSPAIKKVGGARLAQMKPAPAARPAEEEDEDAPTEVGEEDLEEEETAE